MSLIILLGLHHLADTIQPGWLIKNKKEHLFAHYEHAFTWATIVSLGLVYIGMMEVWKFIFLLVGHGIIDYTFYRLLPKDKNYNWVWLDQPLHYLQILIVWL